MGRGAGDTDGTGADSQRREDTLWTCKGRVRLPGVSFYTRLLKEEGERSHVHRTYPKSQKASMGEGAMVHGQKEVSKLADRLDRNQVESHSLRVDSVLSTYE